MQRPVSIVLGITLDFNNWETLLKVKLVHIEIIGAEEIHSRCLPQLEYLGKIFR